MPRNTYSETEAILDVGLMQSLSCARGGVDIAVAAHKIAPIFKCFIVLPFGHLNMGTALGAMCPAFEILCHSGLMPNVLTKDMWQMFQFKAQNNR